MSTDRSPTAPVDLDTQELHRMGYSQELRRSMGAFSNFAVSFSIISILTGGITTYYLGMDAGGPRAITLGWIVVGIFVLCVGASMGEICSAYPWPWSPCRGSCRPGSGSPAPGCRARPRSWRRSSATWPWARSTTDSSEHPVATFAGMRQRVSFPYRTLVMERIVVMFSRRVVR